MNYWERWYEDWHSCSSQLTPEQKGLLAELIDYLCKHEVALPRNFSILCRISGAHTEQEHASLKFIVEHCLKDSGDGYTHTLAEAQILKRKAYLESRRPGGFARHGKNGAAHPAAAQSSQWRRTKAEGDPGTAIRPSIVCVSCRTKVFTWTDDKCDPCWKKEQGFA